MPNAPTTPEAAFELVQSAWKELCAVGLAVQAVPIRVTELRTVRGAMACAVERCMYDYFGTIFAEGAEVPSLATGFDEALREYRVACGRMDVPRINSAAQAVDAAWALFRALMAPIELPPLPGS